MTMENLESPPAESPPASEDSAPGIIQFGDDAECKLTAEISDIKHRMFSINKACRTITDLRDQIEGYEIKEKEFKQKSENFEKKEKECKQISENYEKIIEENKKLVASNNQNKVKIFKLEETIELNKKLQQKYEKENNENENEKFVREISEKKKEINQLKHKIIKIEREKNENNEAIKSQLSVYEKKCKDYERENKELKQKLGIKSPKKRKNQQLTPPNKTKKKSIFDTCDDSNAMSLFEENALKEFMAPELPLLDETPTPIESSPSNSSIGSSKIIITTPRNPARDSCVNTDEILKPKKVDKQIMTDEFYNTKDSLPSIDQQPTVIKSSPSNSSIDFSKIMITAPKNPTRDSSVNTDKILKPKQVDKQIMTDEFYNINDDVYPLFCSKCRKHFDVPPIDEICEAMKEQLPPPLSPMKRQRKSQNFHQDELSTTVENNPVIANRFETLEKRVNVCERQLKNIGQHSSGNTLIGSPQLVAFAEFLTNLGNLENRDSLTSNSDRRKTSDCLNNRKSLARKRKLSSLHDSDVDSDSPVYNGFDSGDDFDDNSLKRTSTTCYKKNKLYSRKGQSNFKDVNEQFREDQEPQCPDGFEERSSDFDGTVRMSEADLSLKSSNRAEVENNTLKKRKKSNSTSTQSNLLKKVRNLKKNSSGVVSVVLNTNQETNIDSNKIIGDTGDVLPRKKKTRVAHALTNDLSEQNMINDNLTEKLNGKSDISVKGLLDKRVTRSVNKNLNKPVEQKKKFKLPVRMTKQIMALKNVDENEDGKNNHLGCLEDKIENETSKNIVNSENVQEENIKIQEDENIKNTNENCLLEKTEENEQIEENKNRKDNLENNITIESEEKNEIIGSNCEAESLDDQDQKNNEISRPGNEEKNKTVGLLENANDLDKNEKEILESSLENVEDQKIVVTENEEKNKSLPKSSTDNSTLKCPSEEVNDENNDGSCGGPEETEEKQEKTGENNANEHSKPEEKENKDLNESQTDKDKLVSETSVKDEEKKQVLDTDCLPEEVSQTDEKTEDDSTMKNLEENEQDVATKDALDSDDDYSEMGDLQIAISPASSPSPSLSEEDDQLDLKLETTPPPTPEKIIPKPESPKTPEPGSRNLRKRQQPTSPTKSDNTSPKKSRDSLNSSRPGTIGYFLDEYLEKHKEKATATPAQNARRKKIASKYREKEGKFIKEKLNNLINHPEWNKSLHEKIKSSLLNTTSCKLVAKCIVEILCEITNEKVVLNKNFTPPAPLLTDNERKIVVLVTDIETNMPDIFIWVYKAIERILFKLKDGPDTSVVSCLSRVYVTLSKIKKDRERVRIMCCDALYCLQKRAVIVLHAVLTSWSEILPRYNSSKDQYLQCCIGHVVTSNDYFEPKLKQVKRLIKDYYKYPRKCDDPLSTDLTDKLLDAFVKKSDKYAKTAILLLAKKLGTDWTYKNIIDQRLLKIISQDNCTVVPDVIKLIGLLMKSFPKQDDGTIENIIHQLIWLVEEGETTPEVQEGLISALLCLSRFRFPEIALAVLNWQPTKSLSPFVQEQLNSFYKARKPSAWVQIRNRNFKNDKKIFLTSRSTNNLITALQRKKL